MTLLKVILFALVVLIFIALVNSINAETPEAWNAINDKFGRDVIEDTPCMDNPNMKQAYSYSGDMIVTRACWYREGDNIHIVFGGKVPTKVYPISAFTTKGFGWF